MDYVPFLFYDVLSSHFSDHSLEEFSKLSFIGADVAKKYMKTVQNFLWIQPGRQSDTWGYCFLGTIPKRIFRSCFDALR
ncbi:hypothetical protein L596_019819 [Steinernema carpocapsae]|uniref:Uncharacterized protein n=1 Tax=Steinernema carpocapsae TaxID=34508 RepID=A0A4U5MRP5_STECR|nr:hypothetical protein L596_019819 [Steinernema carpocapsae]